MENGNFSSQNAYLCCLTTCKPIQRERDGSRSRKQTGMYVYSTVLDDDVRIEVCKKYFLDSFQISNGRLLRAVVKVKESKPLGEDKHGKKGFQSHKITKAMKVSVRKYIRYFSQYHNHYTRTQLPNKLYLHPDLNINKMYDMYKDSCSNEGILPVKQSYYRFLFNTKFNLYFKIPK